MIKRLGRFWVALVLALPVLASGCGYDGEASALASNPVINVTYTADFKGETPSGDLELVIGMTIENNGYPTVSVSPADFTVEVAGYTYLPEASDLSDGELENGEKVSGNFTYNVPPQAATTRVGYRLTYAGNVPRTVRWVKAAPAELKTAAADPAIDIGYSTRLMWVAAPGIQFLEVEPPGMMFLMVEMTVENRGYASFSTNPDYFSLNVSSLVGNYTAGVEGQLVDWRDINLQNSGRFTGTLAFPVPREIASSFYQWDYKFAYAGARAYNVRWSKINLFKYLTEPEETALKAVDLPDGGVLSGTLAFAIAPEVAGSNARYEMFYDEETEHNVQWVDRPGLEVDVNRDAVGYPAIKITYTTALVQKESRGRLYLVVDVKIENRGYASFNTSPGNFYLEISY